MENKSEYLSSPMGDSVEEEPKWKRTLPPGYMFAPLDKEIFKYYLLPKVKGEYFHPKVIPEVDIYQCQPSQLPGLDPKRAFSYFFTKTDKKHQNGKRLNRFTKDQKGHWRITSKIHEVTEEDGETVIGRKNVLVYMYENKVKTNWIMHEYMLDHNYANKNEGDKLDTSVVVCRIYERKTKNNCENNSDESEVRDVEQKQKRGSSSSWSQSDDPGPGESSSRDKRWKLCMINQTSLNSSPLDVQQPAAAAATMIMQTTHWEEALQPLSDQLASNNNGCYLMDEAPPPLNHPFDVQLNSLPQQPATYREEVDELAASNNTYFLIDQSSQLHHSFDVQPTTCLQPATQNNGEEAVLPSLDQMAFNNEGHISLDELQLPHLHPMEKLIPQPRKEPNLKGEGKEDDQSDFDIDSFFL